jgi:hypothetical protein
MGEITILRTKQEEAATRAQYYAAVETGELRVLSLKDTLLENKVVIKIQGCRRADHDRRSNDTQDEARRGSFSGSVSCCSGDRGVEDTLFQRHPSY